MEGYPLTTPDLKWCTRKGTQLRRESPSSHDFHPTCTNSIDWGSADKNRDQLISQDDLADLWHRLFGDGLPCNFLLLDVLFQLRESAVCSVSEFQFQRREKSRGGVYGEREPLMCQSVYECKVTYLRAVLPKRIKTCRCLYAEVTTLCKTT